MTGTVKNLIEDKSNAFALEFVQVYKMLSTEKRKFILSKHLLRSGTSIGANIRESLAGESKRDFIHKMHISLKETRGTTYWLNLVNDSDFLPVASFESLRAKCEEIHRLLNSIIITTK